MNWSFTLFYRALFPYISSHILITNSSQNFEKLKFCKCAFSWEIYQNYILIQNSNRKICFPCIDTYPKGYMDKTYRNKTYRDKTYRPKTYRRQIISATKYIGDKTYRRQNVSATKHIGDKTYRRQNVSGTKCVGHTWPALYVLGFIHTGTGSKIISCYISELGNENVRFSQFFLSWIYDLIRGFLTLHKFIIKIRLRQKVFVSTWRYLLPYSSVISMNKKINLIKIYIHINEVVILRKIIFYFFKVKTM